VAQLTRDGAAAIAALQAQLEPVDATGVAAAAAALADMAQAAASSDKKQA
jgi:hypothetical protein